MKTSTLRILCAAAALFALTSQAADPALGDRHVSRGMQCQACHDANNKVKQNGDLDICSSCHGNYEQMIKKTDGKFEVNPHAQHEGLLPCTECHKGHKESVNYCGGCHNFVYKVP